MRVVFAGTPEFAAAALEAILAAGFDAYGVTVAGPGYQARIKRVRVRLAWRELLHGRLVVESLGLLEPAVTIVPSGLQRGGGVARRLLGGHSETALGLVPHAAASAAEMLTAHDGLIVASVEMDVLEDANGDQGAKH